MMLCDADFDELFADDDSSSNWSRNVAKEADDWHANYANVVFPMWVGVAGAMMPATSILAATSASMMAYSKLMQT